jgi:hypothetical protein
MHHSAPADHKHQNKQQQEERKQVDAADAAREYQRKQQREEQKQGDSASDLLKLRDGQGPAQFAKK